jgi:rod shape-determining protein MreD
MKRTILFWAVAALLPILHFFFHVGLGWQWAPDLLSVGLLLAAREFRMGQAAGVGFALGLLEDAFSILSFGANTLALTVVGILGSRSRDLFVGETFGFMISYLAIGTWLRIAIHWLAAGDGRGGDVATLLLIRAPLEGLYAAGVGLAILLLTGAWTRGDVR